MTKISLFAVLLFIGASSFAQTQTEKEIKDLLVHKWKLTHMEEGGQKAEIPAELGESFLDFKIDGTVFMIDGQDTEKGKWTYNHKIRTITTQTEDEIQKMEIIKITVGELVIKGTSKEFTMTMYLKRVK